uniref:Uncharacterized protein n=1 Tax=Paramormyrops kingsleyae TaxID=1676925 RepID=A0A3B3SZQ2_9TELE
MCAVSNGLVTLRRKVPSRRVRDALSPPVQLLQVNRADRQSEMRSSKSLGDLKGSPFKGAEKTRKHSTGSVRTGRSSPPPGSVPEEQQQIARQGSYTSINSEGEFIPETPEQNILDPFRSLEDSLSDDCDSLDQTLDSPPFPQTGRDSNYPSFSYEYKGRRCGMVGTVTPRGPVTALWLRPPAGRPLNRPRFVSASRFQASRPANERTAA